VPSRGQALAGAVEPDESDDVELVDDELDEPESLDEVPLSDDPESDPDDEVDPAVELDEVPEDELELRVSVL
jgi:hypothetical protein